MFRKILSLARTKGRANRLTYWAVVIWAYIGLIGSMLLLVKAANYPIPRGSTFESILPWIVYPLFAVVLYGLWASVATAIRRLHDRNKSGAWALLFILAPMSLMSASQRAAASGMAEIEQTFPAGIALILTLWGLVELGFISGTAGDNRYGPDPKARKDQI